MSVPFYALPNLGAVCGYPTAPDAIPRPHTHWGRCLHRGDPIRLLRSVVQWRPVNPEGDSRTATDSDGQHYDAKKTEKCDSDCKTFPVLSYT